MVTPTGTNEQRLSLIHVDDVASAVLAWLDTWQHCREQIFTLDDGHSGGYSWRVIAQIASGGRYYPVKIPAWLLSGAATINLSLSHWFRYSPMLTPGKARELTQADWVCNNRALNEASGWTPAIELEAGLSSLFGSPGRSKVRLQ